MTPRVLNPMSHLSRRAHRRRRAATLGHMIGCTPNKSKLWAATPSHDDQEQTGLGDTVPIEVLSLPCHYAVLGLRRQFTADELKRAYRLRSLEHHPDQAGGSASAFARIGAAHDCLADAACRASYDVGGDLPRPNAEQSFEQAVEYHYFPRATPFEPFGTVRGGFAEKRRGRAAWNPPTRGPPPPPTAASQAPQASASTAGAANRSGRAWLV